MRISHSSYKKYVEQLNKELKDQKVYSPLLLNNRTLVFPLIEKAHKVLIISLNPKNPIVFLAENDLFFSSFENSFLAKFRKHYGKSLIKNVSLKDDDLILKIEMYSTDEYVDYSLICELIPNRPNLLIVDEDNHLVDHYFSSKERGFSKGEKYEPLANENFIDGEIQIDEELFSKIIKEEYENRLKEKYSEFTKFITSKIKSANRKIKAIEGNVENASKNLIYREFADNILSLGLDLKVHLETVKIDDKKVELDPSKSLLENVQNFYKKSKKAKETINRANLNIDVARKELAEYTKIYEEFMNGDERKKDELVLIYSNNKKKKETKATIVNRPWKINLNGTIIYFGRNASQNDYLSFVMKLDREFTWMHIKDKSGAHLVIANKKPTDNELLTAAEIALLCSRVTTGEVSYTKKKNVRRGHVLGEAILKNHTVIKLNNIRKETNNLFVTAVRLD